MKYCNDNRIEELGFIVCIALIGSYYFGAFPEAAEYYLRYSMQQVPASGTILYYSEKEDSRGFTFVDARKLPEIEKIFIATPEITNSDFRPKFALSADGLTFYYTTPHSLVQINLSEARTSTNFRRTVVNSEVFNFFSQIAYVEDRLLAKLNNETWVITAEGRLQQTTQTMPSVERPIINGPYEVDFAAFNFTTEVQWSSYLPGNFDLGESAELNVWLPQTVQLFKEDR